jgi:hypothetical protein
VTQGLGKLPHNIDERDLAAVQKILEVGLQMIDERGIQRPMAIAPMVAYRIVQALR